MKKLILTIFFYITLLSMVLCQKTTYTGGEIYIFVQKDGVILTEIPQGRDAEVNYDEFYKKYTIYYTDSDNKFHVFPLKFIQQKSIYMRMVDDFDHLYDVHDLLKEKKKLIIFNLKIEENGTMAGFVIRNLKKS